MADLGLSSSEDEAPIDSKVILSEDRTEHSPVDSHQPAHDGLGLSDSSDDESSAAAILPAPPKPAAQDLDLGLSDSSDDEGQAAAPPVGRAVTQAGFEDLGLDSDSDDEGAMGGGAGGTGTIRPQEKRERETHHYNIPSLPRPSSSSTAHTVKIPPQLNVETEEFDPSSAGAFVERNLDTQNQMLWRYKRDEFGKVERDADGKAVKESNARLAKWSDGSMQLYVGNEVYEVTTLPSENSFIYAKQTNISEEGEEEHEGVESSRSSKLQTILECHGKVESRFGLRLAGLDEEALKKIKSKKHQQSTKVSKVKTVSISDDPNRVQAEREKQAKASRGGSSKRGAAASKRRLAQNARDNDAAQYDESNVSQIKSQFYGKGHEDDDDDDGGGRRNVDDDDDSEDDGVVGGEDEDDEDDEIEDDNDDDDDDDDDGEVMQGRNKKRKSTVGDLEDGDSSE